MCGDFSSLSAGPKLSPSLSEKDPAKALLVARGVVMGVTRQRGASLRVQTRKSNEMEVEKKKNFTSVLEHLADRVCLK